MKTLKLILGILSLIFSVVVLIQSCAAGVVNTLQSSGDVGGSAGFLVALFFIAGGVVMIATRNSEKKGGSIACLILYIVAALLGFSNSAVYKDLIVWSVFALVLAIVCLVSIIKMKISKTQNSSDEAKGN